jgi:stage V sporulation protein B
MGFEYFSIAHDLFMPFYALAISGLPVAISKITAEALASKCYTQVKDNFKTTKKLFTILGVIFSLSVAVLSIPLVLSKNGIGNLYSIIAVVPSVFLCFIVSVYRGYFEGFSNMYPTAISKILEGIVKLIVGLLLSLIVIKLTNNPALASAAAISSFSLGTLISTLYLRSKFKRNNPLNKLNEEESSCEKSSPLTLKIILILAIPFVLSSLANSVVALIDVFTMNLQFSNASAEYLDIVKNMHFSNNLTAVVNEDITTYLYGVKSKAFTIYNLIPIVTMSLGIAALPVLTQSVVSKDDNALKNNTAYILKMLFCITLPVGIGLIVLGQPIMNLLYSSTDTLSGNLLSIYGVAALFAGVAIPVTTILQALNYHYKALIHIIIGIVIKIVSNIVLLSFPQINIYAAPIGTVLCYLYIMIAFFILLSLRIKGLNLFKITIKPLISAVLCGVTAYFVSIFSNDKIFTVLAISVAGLVYFTFLYIFRTFTKDELKNFFKLKDC